MAQEGSDQLEQQLECGLDKERRASYGFSVTSLAEETKTGTFSSRYSGPKAHDDDDYAASSSSSNSSVSSEDEEEGRDYAKVDKTLTSSFSGVSNRVEAKEEDQDEVDTLTNQMVEALNANESVQWSQGDAKKKQSPLGKQHWSSIVHWASWIHEHTDWTLTFCI